MPVSQPQKVGPCSEQSPALVAFNGDYFPMHYYQHNIGDYRRDTMHLSLLEHGIYRQLLDLYYLNECELNANALRLICVRSAEEVKAAENILKEFFIKTENGWKHGRCDKEINRFKEKSEKAKASANARWKENDANAMRTHSEGNANHKPITNNQSNNDSNESFVASKKADDCPHKEIIALYTEFVPVGIVPKVWDGVRASNLRSRWREDKKRQNLDYWKRLFSYISKSDFLMGKVINGNGRPFEISLDWIVKPQNFAKIIEGKYHAREE